MSFADRDRKRSLDDSALFGPRFEHAYPPPRGGGARGAGTGAHRSRGTRRRRPVKRLVVLALGAAMVAAGGFALAVAFTGGPGNQMSGQATQIPPWVGTSAPKLASAPRAAPLPPSEPVRIEIPSLGVNAPIMRLGQDADGAVQVPPLGDHNLAGWYDRTVLPGQAGTSVILGHVDNFTGPSVFFSIKMLRPGETVTVVRADGTSAEFSVDGVQKVTKATFPSTAIYGNTRYPGLRLITCGGPFDSATRQYLDNIVVYSHLVS